MGDVRSGEYSPFDVYHCNRMLTVYVSICFVCRSSGPHLPHRKRLGDPNASQRPSPHWVLGPGFE